jgi:hypothetical protein
MRGAKVITFAYTFQGVLTTIRDYDLIYTVAGGVRQPVTVALCKI